MRQLCGNNTCKPQGLLVLRRFHPLALTTKLVVQQAIAILQSDDVVSLESAKATNGIAMPFQGGKEKTLSPLRSTQ